MRRTAGADPAVRGRQRHADPLQRPAQAEGVGDRNREAIKHAQGAHRSGASSRNHHARDAPGRNRVRRSVGPRDHGDGDRIELPQGATPEGGNTRWRGFCSPRSTYGRLRFQPSRSAPKLTPSSAERARRERRHPTASTPEEPPALTIRERYSQIPVIARGRAEWVKSTLSGHQRSALCGLSPEVPLNPRRRRRTGRETRRPKFIAATSAQTTTSKATAATTPGANATVDARRHMRRKGRKEVKPSCLPAFGQERCDHPSDGFGLFLVEAERSSDPLHAHLSAGWDCGHFSF